ncbi:hypothetical protein [Epilithonimonas mollis]|uniref:Uncharacterized protein n=1 Tax=Epilithonimonas mollis TaxID=216903 RepID=A0A1M6TGA4_9FLAO|nr:hypothetical protein [Epilithonimonas mollis]SHK55808.1 hypothetical protein SAMN05444371_2848 [Epilithonimonas mollis]
MKNNVKKNRFLLVVILFISMFCVTVKAQSHTRSAPNCILHDAYLKETSKTKNSVSCVDCYCKVCGDKKQKEKEAKRKAEELANQKKNAVPQKNTTVKTPSKAKNEEAILVAPKSKVEKTTVVKLSADDQKIIDIAKTLGEREKLIVGYCSEKERSYWSIVFPVIKNTGKIILTKFKDDTEIILKDNFEIKSKFQYTSFFGGFADNKGYSENKGFQVTGFFIIEFQNMSVENSWNDLVDIHGNCVFDNPDIQHIRYKEDDKIFLLKKKGQDQFTEEYNPVTKKTTPIL